jgi:hypothetical protein
MVVTVSLAAALPASVSHAIVWGEPDGEGHPNVGALFLKFEPGSFALGPGVPPDILPICTGSLVAKSSARGLFLTAGHCVEAAIGASQALAPLDPKVVVSFSGNLHVDLGTLIPVDMAALHWEFGPLPQSFPNAGFSLEMDDIGLLVLVAEQAADLPEPVNLPASGPSPALLDAIGKRRFLESELRAVGFGDDVVEPTPHTRAMVFGVREVAFPRPVNLNDKWLLAQQVGASGSSGVFFGDSGAPIFWVDPATLEEVLVAIAGAPVGNLDVVAVVQHYRIDIARSLEFIEAVKAAEGF